MQFEVIRKSHKKSIVIGIIVFIILAIVLVVRFTFAKYSLVKSFKIAEGTINYKVPDFKIMAMYKNDGNGDIEIETMPESGYAINESKTYCELNGSKDSNVKIYTDEDGKHVISAITKGSRCYLYFDKGICGKACKIILANSILNKRTPDFSKIATTNEGMYTAQDNDGSSYYFRGAVTNNYVKFADKYWRIIRINGDGTIRMIFDGISAHSNGTSTMDNIAVRYNKWSHKDAYWNSEIDNAYTADNAYVGFQYTLNDIHGLNIKSNELQVLEEWYQNNLSSYASKIDANAGFCGDRMPSTSDTTSNGLGGTGTTQTYYGAYIRLKTNKAPLLTCKNSSDLYTMSVSNKGSKSLSYPIGLINADEISMAGGVWYTENDLYYLYNGHPYTSMSPYAMGNIGSLFTIDGTGRLNSTLVYTTGHIRPVINLRSDTKFTFTGTGEKGSMTNPYIVE